MSFRHPVSIFFLREGPNSPSHLGGNQHLATHVAALLSARLLVLHPASGSWAKCHWDVLKAKGGLGTIMIPASSLNVDASGAVLNEHLGELHSGGDASMASVCICDDGIQVVLIAIRVGSKKNCTEFIYSKPSVSHTNVSLARARSTTEKCYCAATIPTMPSKHQPLESWRARLDSCDVAPRTASDRGRAGLGRADPPD